MSGTALAQAFPSRNVTLVVPNPPGGAIDIQARIYAQKLQEMWGQPVVVDYKPGAGTLLGMEHVARSAPDGHTLGMVVTPLVILPGAAREDALRHAEGPRAGDHDRRVVDHDRGLADARRGTSPS